MDKRVRKKTARHWFQAAWFAVTNGYVTGFLKGKIYSGPSKAVCVPGLNCYSCPGALGACPIGALQAVLGSGTFRFSCYVFGLLALFGTVLGRVVCGWLCPFGLAQELLHKLPLWKKRKNLPGHRWLKWGKYLVLGLFVVFFPLVTTQGWKLGDPWFCKYICPSGTLSGGIPLVLLNGGMRWAIGWLFYWKLLVLLAVVLLSVKFYRPFCKYLCPLGAVYGWFNPISLFRIQVDREKCVQCGSCRESCGMDIPVWEKPNSVDCVRCGDCKRACPTGAVRMGFLLKKEQSPNQAPCGGDRLVGKGSGQRQHSDYLLPRNGIEGQQ